MSALMTGVFWTLGGTRYDSYADFVAAVTDYNQAISPTKNKWAPNEAVALGPIRVVYEALWKDQDDKIALDVGEPGKSLTMGWLLFTLNNATCAFFEDADAHFFEGLVLVSGATYRLRVGS